MKPGVDTPSAAGGLKEAVNRRASVLQTFRAVAWSFFGVRRSADHTQDVQKLNPVHVIIAGVVSAAIFAVRVPPHAEPTLSPEHDAARWLTVHDAHDEVIWPGYRTAIERIRDDLSDHERAPWFELTLDGDRRPRI